MPPEVTEVTIVTEETPPTPPAEDNPNPQQSTDMTVGELKAKVEQLENQVQALAAKDSQIESLVEEVHQIQRWSQDDLNQMMEAVFLRMSEIETQIVENESESEIESIEEESENLSEIPAIPEVIQEEPEEVQVTERRRPWFL